MSWLGGETQVQVLLCCQFIIGHDLSPDPYGLVSSTMKRPPAVDSCDRQPHLAASLSSVGLGSAPGILFPSPTTLLSDWTLESFLPFLVLSLLKLVSSISKIPLVLGSSLEYS